MNNCHNQTLLHRQNQNHIKISLWSQLILPSDSKCWKQETESIGSILDWDTDCNIPQKIFGLEKLLIPKGKLWNNLWPNLPVVLSCHNYCMKSMRVAKEAYRPVIKKVAFHCRSMKSLQHGNPRLNKPLFYHIRFSRYDIKNPSYSGYEFENLCFWDSQYIDPECLHCLNYRYLQICF